MAVLGLTPTSALCLHTPISEGQQMSPGLSGVLDLSLGVFYPRGWYPPLSFPSCSCALGATQPAPSSSLKIRSQWDTAGVFARLNFYLLTEEYETPGSLEGPSRDAGGASPKPCTPTGAREKRHPLADCSRAGAAGCCLSLGKQRSCAMPFPHTSRQGGAEEPG